MKRTNLNPFEQRVYAAAISFTAFQFGGRGNRHRYECATEAEAIEKAGQLRKMYPLNTRPAMVYAVDRFGNSAMIGTV